MSLHNYIPKNIIIYHCVANMYEFDFINFNTYYLDKTIMYNR